MISFRLEDHHEELKATVAGFARDLLDLQRVVDGNAILLAASFDDCEHCIPHSSRGSISLQRGSPARLLVKSVF